MAAPSLIAYSEIAWSTNQGAASTGSVSWQTGDVVIVLGGSEDSSVPVAAPTVTGLTFAAITGAICNAGSDTYANAWVATAASSSSGAIATTGAGTSRACGLSVWVWRGSAGVGNVGSSGSTANTNLTQSLVRGSGNSCVIGGLFDWNAAATTSYAWTPTVGNDRQHVQVNLAGLRYSVYIADWGDQGTAGTTSYGISGITGNGNMARLFVEVKGSATSNANATPAVLACTTTLPAPVVRQDAAPAPAVLACATTLPTAAVTTAGNANITPAVLACTTTLPAPVVQQDATVTPAVLTCATTFPAPAVTLSSTATPAVLTVATSLPAPGVSGARNANITTSPGYPSMPGLARPGRFTPGGSQQAFTLGFATSVTFPTVTVTVTGSSMSGPNYATANGTPVAGAGTWVNPANAYAAPNSVYAVWTVV